MLNILKKKRGKLVRILVSTLEADIEISVDWWTKTRQVFDMVTKIIGLRETSFFGLAIIPKCGHPLWLKLDKKLLDQVPSEYIEEGKDDKTPKLRLQFYAKFYPEKIEDELIQDITRHLFFLQFQKFILKGMLSCEPQAALLLASFSIQAKFGDYDLTEPDNLYPLYQHLLPSNVFDRYDRREVEEQITTWHMSHQGLTREEAESEYLKIVHDFEMSGISYFKIQDGNGAWRWLGVNAKEVALYSSDDKVHPTTRIGWGSLSDMSYSGTKFIMKQTSLPTTAENLTRRVRELSSGKDQPQQQQQQQTTNQLNKSKTNLIETNNGTSLPSGLTALIFVVEDPDNCKLIMDLCRGNHEMYMQRRRVGNTMEMQQMKALAKEDKQRRELEKERIRKEHELQTQMQQDKDEMDDKYKQLELRYSDAMGALTRADETVELLQNKVQAYEEEVDLLRAKDYNREAEIQNYKTNVENLQASQRELESECENYKDVIEQLHEKFDHKEEENRLLEDKLHETQQLLNDANYTINQRQERQVNNQQQQQQHASQSSNPTPMVAPSNHPQQQNHYNNIQDNQATSWNPQPTSSYIYSNTTPTTNTQQQYYVHHSASNSFNEQQQMEQSKPPLVGLSQYDPPTQFDPHNTSSYDPIGAPGHELSTHNEDTMHSLSLQLKSEQSNIHSKSMVLQQQLQQVNAQMEDYHKSYDDNDNVSPSSIANSQENLFTSE